MNSKEYFVAFLWMALFIFVMLGIDIVAPIISPWFGPLVVIVFIVALILLMVKLARR
jgi:hypothetical protein